jgi:bifunctional non-homologous end joining protein LigD
MALEEYNRKRDFGKTLEPRGDADQHNGSEEGSHDSPELRFVVQEHHARALHYDFRLEMDSVLKSWAVPKGPPADFKTRRLAIQTEDHPLSYIDFAGSIAPGNYGAGEVSIWDSGAYDNVSARDLLEGMERGKLEVVLHGKRLSGQFDLIRIDDERRQWLMIRSHGKNADSKPVATPTSNGHKPSIVKKTDPVPAPESVTPMLAVTVDKPFSDPNWQYEIKWDGYRALLFIDEGKEQLISRNHIALDSSFPELAKLAEDFKCSSAVIDGEIVALTSEGLPRFQSLQNRIHFYGRGRSRKKATTLTKTTDQIVYMAFDILYCDGVDLTSEPLTERRRKLVEIVMPSGAVRFSDHVDGNGEELFEKARTLGLEGIMAKRADSAYVQTRSDNWVKIKMHRTQDVVIGGYTESEAAGRPFAALLMGEYDLKGKLVSVGHVGTGFTQKTMASILHDLEDIEIKNAPFEPLPNLNGKPHWVSPKLVAEVKFSEVTDDGSLRQPVFLRLRSDKEASECRLHDATAKNVNDVGKAKPASEPKKMKPKSKPNSSPNLTLPKQLADALAPDSTEENAVVKLERNDVKLTHLAKVFWPSSQTTKRDLLRYYATVSDVMIPHLAGRPLVIQRYPNGVDGQSFFQHDAGEDPPQYLKTYTIVEHAGPVHYALCDELADLLYLVNLGTIPIHSWNVCVEAPDSPDRVVFDIDPPESKNGETWKSAVIVAQTLRQILTEIGLTSFPKTSGSRGLHVIVPINPTYTSDEVIAFSKLIGQLVVDQVPELVSTERRINKRGVGKVYFDCVQNGVGKTLVAPYSARARPTPTVSTPLFWDEVVDSLRPESFTINSVPDRIHEHGELMAAVARPNLAQDISMALKAMAEKYNINENIEENVKGKLNS